MCFPQINFMALNPYLSWNISKVQSPFFSLALLLMLRESQSGHFNASLNRGSDSQILSVPSH